MTRDTYTKQLDDLHCELGSLWESVSDGNISAKDILDELNGMQSDLAFIIDAFMDLELDELLQLGAE